MKRLQSPKGLSPTGVAPLFVLAVLPFLAAAIIATLLWPDATRFPTRPNAPFIVGGIAWLAIGIAFWAKTLRRFLRGFPRGELITDGTFAWCRNPIYASFIVFVIPAVGLIAETWTFLALAVIAAALALWLVRREESELAQLFGLQWDAHAARTNPLLPMPTGKWTRRLGRVSWVAMALLFLYAGALRTWHLRWGATSEELVRALPGDTLVAEPDYRSTHAITIHAPPEKVWPWLVQLGWSRGGLYSYEWLENLFGCQMKNADRIVPEWQDTKVGDVFRMDPRVPPLEVAVVDAPHAFVIYGGPKPPNTATDAQTAAWQFIVEPHGAAESRLLVRWQSTVPPGFLMELLSKTMLEPIHFMMEERMMRGIKERAEASAL